jgi:hypothetical protein
MEEVTDPVELAKARAQRKRFDRNAAWLQAHAMAGLSFVANTPLSLRGRRST